MAPPPSKPRIALKPARDRIVDPDVPVGRVAPVTYDDPMPRSCLLLPLAGLAACGRLNFDEAPRDTVTPDPYRDLIVGDRPLSYWRLGEATGTVAVDELGRVDGTYVGECELGVPGAITGNSAVRWTRPSPRCVVTFGSAFDFPDRAPYTIEGWISPTPGERFGHIFTRQRRQAPNPLDGYAILQGPTGIYTERVVGLINQATMAFGVKPNVFIHVAAVYNGETLTLYADGLARASSASTLSSTPFDTTTTIGCIDLELVCFAGVIDEVAIYDRALSEATIRSHRDARMP